MRAPASLWVVDPDDPRAPPTEIWNAMTPTERKHVEDSLSSAPSFSRAMRLEGDLHFNAKVNAREVLEGYFARTGRRVYLACELPVVYPGEKMFAPDLVAVVDVEVKERQRWIVSAEGKGLDFVLEVVVADDRRKGLTDRLERYARLGVSEVFIFDRRQLQLRGYRIAPSKPGVYQPILPQRGVYASNVLDLDMRIEGTRLRFYYACAPFPDAREMFLSLQRFADDIDQRLTAAEERADEEGRQRAEVEQKLAAALAEIARLQAELGAGGGQSPKN